MAQKPPVPHGEVFTKTCSSKPFTSNQGHTGTSAYNLIFMYLLPLCIDKKNELDQVLGIF